MNIFILDGNIEKCVQYYMDKHVVKQILEHVQMMMGAYYYSEKHIDKIDKMVNDGLYKLTHKNHPCSIWVRESEENWHLLFDLTYDLNEERKYRFKNNNSHKALGKLRQIIDKYNIPQFPQIERTNFRVCMPDYCKKYTNILMPDNFRYKIDPIESYRNYYINEKQHLAKWTNRPVPSWY